jgi:hypothetical protein
VLQGPSILYGLGPGFYDDTGILVPGPDYRNATQYMVAGATTGGPWWGNGTVAEITFRVAYQPNGLGNPASCPLNLTYTALADANLNLIVTTASSGSYTVLPLAVLPGDINGDWSVDLKDLVLLADAYGSGPGLSNWNPKADIDNNGIVGLGDLAIMAKYYGQRYP